MKQTKVHLCTNCSLKDKCDWYKYCEMNTVVYECKDYKEKEENT